MAYYYLNNNLNTYENMDLENAMLDCLIECKDNRKRPTQDEFINSVEYHLTEPPSEVEKDIIAEFYHLHFE